MGETMAVPNLAAISAPADLQSDQQLEPPANIGMQAGRYTVAEAPTVRRPRAKPNRNTKTCTKKKRYGPCGNSLLPEDVGSYARCSQCRAKDKFEKEKSDRKLAWRKKGTGAVERHREDEATMVRI